MFEKHYREFVLGIAGNAAFGVLCYFNQRLLETHLALAGGLLGAGAVAVLAFDFALWRSVREGRRIASVAPQLSSFGRVSRYASNGVSHFRFEGASHAEARLRIRLQPLREFRLEDGMVSDCGVILFRDAAIPGLREGYDVSRYRELCFEISPGTAAARIGLGYKDVRDIESKIPLRDLCPPGAMTSGARQEIVVPLDRLTAAASDLDGHRSRLAALSFFANSLLSGTEPVEFEVSRLRFR